MVVLSVVGDYFTDLWASIITFFSNNGMEIATRAILALLVIVGGHYLIKLLVFILRKAARINDRRVDRSARAFVINLLKLILNVILFLAVLSIIKVDLSGLATIISAAVLAIGLSIQDVIANFASGVIILSTKPFLTGDWVEIDGASGSVENVGMLTTSIITIDQQRVNIPNKIVVNTKITNYNAKPTRRAAITLPFAYQVDVDQVRAIGFEIINADERILRSPDPAIVIDGFDERGVKISFRFHTRTVEFWAVLFEFNEKLLKELQAKDITPMYRKYQIEMEK